MKPEQIAELRQRARDHASYENWLDGDELVHVLDEREMLLSAAKQLLHTIVLREGDAAITGPGIFGMRAAIAKAES